ncbi:MAG TPA: alpha/beta fold hydrolase [Bdellovibrionota bacterium]|nr:alpha/beta fold hydrolase [Bdellovibrionota bacterium]
MSTELRAFLRVKEQAPPPRFFERLEERQFEGYRRQLIRYPGTEGDEIPAYLFLPEGPQKTAAVIVHHQHNGERHLGKSEVAGIAGDPLQAFGPALASRGVTVLAPDSICFEDRRRGRKGLEPGPGEDDWLQHYNEMSVRLCKGDTLMRKLLEEADIGLSLLASLPSVDPHRIGALGHSYGGNTVLFQAAIDSRVSFACASGAVCSYEDKFERSTGLEMALVIPGIHPRFDFPRILASISPREILVVSAEEDRYSRDADQVVRSAMEQFRKDGSEKALKHRRFPGAHALTRERFDHIVEWACSRSPRINGR